MRSNPSFEQLAEKLFSAARHDRRVALAALSTAHMMLGMQEVVAGLYGRSLAYLGEGDRYRLEVLQSLWESFATAMPYLRGMVEPLVGFIDHPSESELAGLAACFQVLADVDLEQCIKDVGGDLLGPVYTGLLSKHERDAGGKFYTPMPISTLIAKMNQVSPGESVCDPCCGSGGMAVAVVLDLLERGLSRNSCSFTLADIDPMAVALAGVNMACRGVENVRLIVGDSLAPDWLETSPPLPRPS